MIGAFIINLPGIREEFIWHALYGTSLLFALYPDIAERSSAGHLWSLNVEEQFYFIWPFIVFLLPIRYLWLAFGAVLTLGIYGLVPDNSLPQAPLDTGTSESWDSLAIGALIALAQAFGINLRRFDWASIPAACVVSAYLTQWLGSEDAAAMVMLFGHETANILFALTIVNVVTGAGGWIGYVLDNRVLQYLGRISYGMYPYHLLIIDFWGKVLSRIGRDDLFNLNIKLFIFIYVVTVLAASVSWRFLEAPINSYRSRLNYAQYLQRSTQVRAAV